MPNGRIALRVSHALVADIDAAAAASARTRTNWITWTLGEVTPLPSAAIKALQKNASDRREKMLSWRMPAKAIGKLDKVAAGESRTRSEVILRLLTAAVRPEWRGELAKHARREADAERHDTEDVGVFA